MSALPEAAVRAASRGNEAFGAGALEEAERAWREALQLLPREQAEVARALWENLGLALHNLGRWHEAERAFLRALDGDLGSRQQSLRFLIEQQLRTGRLQEARRALLTYTQRFGPHPGGWTLDAIERLLEGQAARRARVIPC